MPKPFWKTDLFNSGLPLYLFRSLPPPPRIDLLLNALLLPSSGSLALREIGKVPTVAAVLDDIGFVNGMYLSSTFMLNLLKRITSEHYKRPRIMMRSCTARFGQNFLLCVNFLSLKQAVQASVFDPVYVGWVLEQTPAERASHAKLKSFVLNEEWWSRGLEVIGLTWPIILVMRAGERTLPAPGRLLHCMLEAEDKLNQAAVDNEPGTFKRALAEDLLPALNKQHDGFRYEQPINTKLLQSGTHL